MCGLHATDRNQRHGRRLAQPGTSENPTYAKFVNKGKKKRKAGGVYRRSYLLLQVWGEGAVSLTPWRWPTRHTEGDALKTLLLEGYTMTHTTNIWGVAPHASPTPSGTTARPLLALSLPAPKETLPGLEVQVKDASCCMVVYLMSKCRQRAGPERCAMRSLRARGG